MNAPLALAKIFALGVQSVLYSRRTADHSVFLSLQLADVITAVALYLTVKEYNKQVVRKWKCLQKYIEK